MSIAIPSPRYARRAALPPLLALLAACARAPVAPPLPPPSPPALEAPEPAGPDLLGVLAYSLSLQGRPYRPGGETPEHGFDCSGFVRYVYRQLGLELPRDTRAMAAGLPAAPADTRRPGDLVFFNTSGRAHSHVGIYLGEDRFIHAPSRRTGRVKVSDFTNPWWRSRFDGLRRPPLGP